MGFGIAPFSSSLNIALPAWSATVTYALNAEVIDTATRIIYRSLAAANLGNPLTDATKWQPRMVENRLRMFDSSLGTYTEADDYIEFTVTPGRVVTDMQLMEAGSSA